MYKNFFFFFVLSIKSVMSLSTSAKLLNDAHNNLQNAHLMYSLYASPIMRPTPYQTNIPWCQKKIEIPETFTYRENRSFRFTLPRSGLIDPRSIRLSFNCRAVPTGAVGTVSHQAGFVFDINSLFSDVSLNVGRNQVLSHQRAYNMIARTTAKIGNEFQINNTQRGLYMGGGRALDLFNGAESTSRMAYHTLLGQVSGTRYVTVDVSRRYMTPITLGLFVQQRPLVLDPFNEQLELEITLDKGDIALVNHLGPAPAVTQPPTIFAEIGYPTLHFTYFDLGNTPLYKQVQNQLDKTGFSYQYVQWMHNQSPLNAKVLRQKIRIPIHHKYIKYALALITCDEDRASQAFSSFRTYATLDPTSTNGNTLLTTDPVKEERRNQKRGCIKTYQWIYNKTQRFPELPVPVINSPEIVSQSPEGTESEPMAGTTKVAPIQPTASQYISRGEEVWYHIEQLFLQNKEMAMAIGLHPNDSMFIHYDSPHPAYGSITNSSDEGVLNLQKYIGASGTTTGRVASNFFMVGNFTQPLYDGTVACLEGGTNNETLELELELNGITSNTSPPKMILHTFVAYDNILVVKNDSVVVDN